MKKWTGHLTALLLAGIMAGGAGAETLSLNGTVEAGVTVPVYAPIGGTVEAVYAEAGERVAAGEELFSYRTEKVYAPEDGTVTGVFVTEGDDAEKVTEKYGADLYIEGETVYSVSASVSKAYGTVENTRVHAGEQVYVLCRANNDRKGTGVITAVDGTGYTVMVTEGNFIIGDSVAIYRSEVYRDVNRIGMGTIARVNPSAVNATGAVTSVAVRQGDTVKRGDLLMETLSGTFDGYRMTGTSVKAAEEGVILSVAAVPGGTVNKGDAAAQIAPISGMRVEAAVGAEDRMLLKAGDPVTIELEADESRSYEGTVRYISGIPEEGTEEVTYKAIIDFTPDEDITFGMPVVVTSSETAQEGTPGE